MVEDRPPGLATLAVHGGGDETSAKAVERRLAVLEGGTAAVMLPAGGAFLPALLQPLMRPGDQIIIAAECDAPSLRAVQGAITAFGWEMRTAPVDDSAAFERAITPRTQAILVTSIAVTGEVADIEVFAGIAKRAGVPLIVDNTLATPALCRPFEFGADIVIHRDARLLSGDMGAVGLVVDGGSFNWLASVRYPMLTTTPDPVGESLAEAIGNYAYAEACRRLAGSALPDEARRVTVGIETLPLRLARHSETALAVAAYLAPHDRIVAISYPGLPGDRHHVLARKYCPSGSGAIVGFALGGDTDAATRFLQALRLIAPEDDARAARTSIATIPSAHAAGPPWFRLSAGLEDAADIIADLEQALAA